MTVFLSDLSVPSLSIVINQEKNQAELHFDDSNESTPSVCVQYENNGQCEVGVYQGQILVPFAVFSFCCFCFFVTSNFLNYISSPLLKEVAVCSIQNAPFIYLDVILYNIFITNALIYKQDFALHLVEAEHYLLNIYLFV